MPDDWSDAENQAIIADYLSMLEAEHRGQEYSKTAHRLALVPKLRNRSKGSIERKHMNISAALIELGYPYIDGYKPLQNFQNALLELVASQLAELKSLELTVQHTVEAQASPSITDDLLSRWVKPPTPEDATYRMARERRDRHPTVVNWLEVESRNRSLGRAGESFVLAFEKARLNKAGRGNLADRVEHVSAIAGDGAGFDIRSFEVNGSDRLIEVKTTAYGKLIPFFLSRNEVTVSRRRSESYYLYRLFHFRDDPRLFGLRGSLEDNCWLDAVQFAARLK